jgi:hypothetical protein
MVVTVLLVAPRDPVALDVNAGTHALLEKIEITTPLSARIRTHKHLKQSISELILPKKVECPIT